MRKIGLLVAAVTLLLCQSANATLFDFSFFAPGFSGGGTIDAQLTNGVTYSIISITGTVNGDAISGPSSFDGAANVVFYPSPAVITNVDGFSFNVAAIIPYSINIYEDFGNLGGNPTYSCNSNPYCLITGGPGQFENLGAPIALQSLTLTAAVPEPSTWAMMILGFLGIGTVTYRRRKAAAFVA